MDNQIKYLVEQKVRLEEKLNLAECRIMSLEEKRTKMNDLYRLTLAVRKAQKAYFASRTQDLLKAARHAEQQLDGFLGKLQNEIHARQMEMSL